MPNTKLEAWQKVDASPENVDHLSPVIFVCDFKTMFHNSYMMPRKWSQIWKECL